MTRFFVTLVISLILMFSVDAAFLWYDPQHLQDYSRGFIVAVVVLNTWTISNSTKSI